VNGLEPKTEVPPLNMLGAGEENAGVEPNIELPNVDELLPKPVVMLGALAAPKGDENPKPGVVV
jgi:hypothetical protein